MSDDATLKASSFEKFVPLLSIAVIALVFVVGVMWQKINNLEKGVKGTTTQQAQATNVPVKLDQIKELFSKDLIKFGDANAKVLFVEVSDPSCPYCHIAAGTNKELIKQYYKDQEYLAPEPEMRRLVEEGKASFVYIYMSGHGNGEMGMKALYCAYEQGKFWETHDILFTSAGYTLMNETIKNDTTQSQKLADFLKKAVDTTRLKECLDSGKYDARLASDAQISASLGVTGTPGFYINTSNFPGAYGYDQMKPVIEEALR